MDCQSSCADCSLHFTHSFYVSHSSATAVWLPSPSHTLLYPLLCGVSSLSAMCLLCKQCAEAWGHSTAYGRQSGRRCERADVRGREFNAFSWEDWNTDSMYHLVCLKWLTHRPKNNISLKFQQATEDREDTAKETWCTDKGGEQKIGLPSLCDRRSVLVFIYSLQDFLMLKKRTQWQTVSFSLLAFLD